VKDVTPGAKSERQKEGEGVNGAEAGADKHKEGAKKGLGGKNGPPEGFDGYGADYHPAELHPADQKYEPLKDSEEGTGDGPQPSGEEENANGVKEEKGKGEHGVSERSATTSSSGSGSKISFMSKLKGEAKVISGKLGRNEEKVHEGRKLMGKE
jgi:hypothetical protein